MSSGADVKDQGPLDDAAGGAAADDHPEADAIDVAVGPGERAPQEPLPVEGEEPRFALAEGEDGEEEPFPQENFPPIVYTISDAADVDITQPTSNLVTIEAAAKKAEESKATPVSSKPVPDPQALDRQAAESQAAKAELAAMLAASTQAQDESAPPAAPAPRPQLVKMRAESHEVAERVKDAKPARPAYMQPPGTIAQKHKSVYGLVRYDKPEEPDVPPSETPPPSDGQS